MPIGTRRAKLVAVPGKQTAAKELSQFSHPSIALLTIRPTIGRCTPRDSAIARQQQRWTGSSPRTRQGRGHGGDGHGGNAALRNLADGGSACGNEQSRESQPLPCDVDGQGCRTVLVARSGDRRQAPLPGRHVVRLVPRKFPLWLQCGIPVFRAPTTSCPTKRPAGCASS